MHNAFSSLRLFTYQAGFEISLSLGFDVYFMPVSGMSIILRFLDSKIYLKIGWKCVSKSDQDILVKVPE